MEKDITTEEKIKEAARKIFQQKGYAGTRTRDIADEAGVNLALLNYYYRSKEKLFELVMEESMIKMFSFIRMMLNDSSENISSKIDKIVNVYLDILLENPNLPLFIMGEVQANPEKLKEKLGLSDSFITSTHIHLQVQEHLRSVGLEKILPIHIILNLLSMMIFPFVAKPLLKGIAGMEESAYLQLIEERRTLIPMWIKSMLKLEE